MRITETTVSQTVTTVRGDEPSPTPPTTAELLRAAAALGLRLAGSAHSVYEETRREVVVPVIGLPADKWLVLDVDSAEGLGLFHRRLGQKQLPGLAAYVLTDKGVLMVYPKEFAGKADIDADVRYERFSQERGLYYTHCLSKLSGKPRKMVVYDDSVFVEGSMLQRKAETKDMLALTWNQLAEQAANLGAWTEALRTPIAPK